MKGTVLSFSLFSTFKTKAVTVHSRHQNIRNHRINLFTVQDLECFNPVGGAENRQIFRDSKNGLQQFSVCLQCRQQLKHSFVTPLFGNRGWLAPSSVIWIFMLPVVDASGARCHFISCSNSPGSVRVLIGLVMQATHPAASTSARGNLSG